MTDTGLVHGSDDWRNARFDCVTATDVGKILGLDAYVSRKRLLESKFDKIDPSEDANETGKYLMMMGRTFEEAAKKSYILHTGERDGFTPSLHAHCQCPFLTGSPDYLVPSKRKVVEFKTHFYPNMVDVTPIADVRNIPLKYYLQVQTYLEIMDYDVADLFSWTILNGETLFRINRDRPLFESVIRPFVFEFMTWMEDIRDTRKDSSIYLSTISKARHRPGEKTNILDCVLNSLLSNTVRNDERDNIPSGRPRP